MKALPEQMPERSARGHGCRFLRKLHTRKLHVDQREQKQGSVSKGVLKSEGCEAVNLPL